MSSIVKHTPIVNNPLITRLNDLSAAFNDDGYDDGSALSKAAIAAFWTVEPNIWFLRGVFPASRDNCGNITPGFPRGGFDKSRQHISVRGFHKLIDTVCENVSAPHIGDRWVSIDGINAPVTTVTSAIQNIVGVIAKPIDNAFIAIECNFNFFDGSIANPELTEFILSFTNAYKVRGDRNTIVLILKQTKKLKSFFSKTYPTVSELSFTLPENSDANITIKFDEGSTVNVFGAHSSFPSYQINLPESDEVGSMSAVAYDKLIELIKNANFVESDISTSKDGSMINAIDAIEDSGFLDSINKISTLVKGVTNLQERYAVSPYLEIKNLIPQTTKDSISGGIRFITSERYVVTDPSDVYKISDGFRTNTVNHVFTDVAFVEELLIAISVPFYNTNTEEVIIEVSRIIEPDISDIQLSRFDSESKTYRTSKAKKWSLEHLKNLYESKYKNKILKPKSYIAIVLDSIIIELSRILQNFLFADKIDTLSSESKKLATPTVDQAVQLAEATDRDDLTEFLSGISDIFDVELIQDTQTSLIDVSDFEYAKYISELKEQHFLKATQDNWEIYPANCREHYARFLSGQIGASYPALMATIASLTSYAGYIQVTADPLDSATFKALEISENRVRYDGNVEGNLVLIMQLMTGDSGAGKSYVIKPLINAARVANVAVNMVDDATITFFRSIHLDNGKLLNVKDFQGLPGALYSSTINNDEYKEIHARIRSKDAGNLLNVNETFTLSDHSAEIAAIRDAMADTELRLLVRGLSHNKLFAGTYNHPIILFFDEASAFMESVYQHGSKITAFCELKAGESKLFRRAKSNISGAQIDIQFFGASMHGNLPLPKYLSMAYRADVKENRAEGVLGRIITGYIKRNKNGKRPVIAKPIAPDRTDEELLSAITTISHLIPNAMRRLEADTPNSNLSYFSSNRKVTNFFYSLEAREELNNVQQRLEAKIEGMKVIYPAHSYAYDTYIGKLWEMIYTISGGHKLVSDLFKMSEIVINRLTTVLFVDGVMKTFTGWEICDYINDRGIQSNSNNLNLMLSVMEALRTIQSDKLIRPIKSKKIKMRSLLAAEIIITHHYDVLLHSESMYSDMFGSTEAARESAKNVNAVAYATSNSDNYMAYKIVENLERQLVRCMRNGSVLRQSDVLRNMLFQASKKAKEPETQKRLIVNTFANIMSEFVAKGVAKLEKSGSSWKLIGEMSDIQPLLSEIKLMMVDTI
jgi:hypothetical protein